MKSEIIKNLKSDIIDAWVKGSTIYFTIRGVGGTLSAECVIDVVRDEGVIYFQGDNFSLEVIESTIETIDFDDVEGKRYDLYTTGGTRYTYEFDDEEENNEWKE